MDKIEYKERLEKIKELAGAGNYEGAALAADTVDWRHVRSVRTLCMIAEIYENNKRYEDSELILKYAYKRSEASKTVLYRLAEINIRLQDLEEARRFIYEFEQLSPRDNSKFILEYRLLKAKNAPLDDQIEVLKELKDREYTERWAYELARLYRKNGQTRKCIEECDDMILWFAEGKYVTKAKALKRELAPLSAAQQMKAGFRREEQAVREEYVPEAETEAAAEPEIASAEPETAAEPEIAAEEPETVAEPEITAVEPETQAVPEITAAEPEIVAAEPEIAAVEPETAAEPEIAAVEPEVTAEPEITAAPAAQETAAEPFAEPYAVSDTQEFVSADAFEQADSLDVSNAFENTASPAERVPYLDAEKMLASEDDESLGLTREFNLQELIRQAMKDGASVSEAVAKVRAEAEAAAAAKKAGKIAAGAAILAPEEAARKAVREASGVMAQSVRPASRVRAEKAESTAKPVREVKPIVKEAPENDDVMAALMAGEDDVLPVREEDMTTGFGVVETPVEDNSAVIGRIMATKGTLPKVRVEIRKLTDTERKIFTYFSDIPGVHEQVTLALADIHNSCGDKTSRGGNIIIQGRPGSGKTHLADGLILSACTDLGIHSVKRARITADELNRKDPASVVKKMSGGFLIIEHAGDLTNETVAKLSKAMEFRTDRLVVILEDAKSGIRSALAKDPGFAEKFTSTIIIPVFTNDELVTFAKTYAKENGCKMDEMGTLALYTIIGENQKESEPMTVGMVRDVMDAAISRAKGRKFGRRFSKNAFGPDGRLLIKEKDFDV
ncbi:MAG: hypothetical protein IKF75_02660 [Lachnospiraceae bacterium]|nr:hypothetical protein [Lachnospiraceae bacterium]